VKAKTVTRGKHRVRIPGESAITWNQQGRPGVSGVSGVQGQKGDTGSTGPSNIHVVGKDFVALSTSAETEVASLTVPAGSYLIGASLFGAKGGGASGGTMLACSLKDGLGGGTVWDGSQTVLTDGAPKANLSLAGADTFSAPKTIKLFCNQAVAVPVSAIDARLWAIQTGSLHATLPLPTD
jgi:hypothetical protein